jgi:hypothetical protein
VPSRINNSFPPALLGLRTIHRIWLDHNLIREIPATIALLTDLERLSMNKNVVRDIPPEIGDCVNLEKLWLNDNEVVTVSPEINRCVKLHTLALANNRIATAPQLHLPNLVDISLENNPCYVPDMEGAINSAVAGHPSAAHAGTNAAAAGTGTVRGVRLNHDDPLRGFFSLLNTITIFYFIFYFHFSPRARVDSTISLARRAVRRPT